MRVVYENKTFNVNISSSEVERDTLVGEVLEGMDCDDDQFIGKPFILRFSDKGRFTRVYKFGLSIGNPVRLDIELSNESRDKLLSGYFYECDMGDYSFEFNVKH